MAKSRLSRKAGPAGSKRPTPRRHLWALLNSSVPGVPDEEVQLALMFFLQQLEMLGNEGRFVWSGPLGPDRARGLTIFEARDREQAEATVAGLSPIMRRVWRVDMLAPWEVDLNEARSSPKDSGRRPAKEKSRGAAAL